MGELKEAWAKCWDFALSLYKTGHDNEKPDEKCIPVGEIDRLMHEFNKEQPFVLTEQLVNDASEGASIQLMTWYEANKKGEEYPELKAHNPISSTIVSYGDWSEREFEHRPSFLDNFMLKGSLTMIHAGAGVGKTPFAMMLCRAMMDNMKFLGWAMGEQRAESVLYLDGELPGDLLKKRLQSCFQDQYKDRISLFSAMDHYDNGYKAVDVMDEHQREMLLDAVLDFAPDVLVIDNRNDFFTGSEDKSEDAQVFNGFLKIIRHRGTAVIVNHHDGKNGEYRGSSAMVSPIDTRIHLTRNTEEEDSKQIVCHMEKIRYGMPETNNIKFTYTLDIDSYGKTSLNLV